MEDLSSSSKRTRGSSASLQEEQTKRERSALTESNEECTHQFHRFKNFELPPAIITLPHVLQKIDLFLMTPDEAAKKAASSGDLVWMEKLLHRFDYFQDIDSIAQAAAANGHLEMVELLSSYFFGYRGEIDIDNFDSVLEMAQVAAKNAHLSVLEFLIPEEIDPELPRQRRKLKVALCQLLEEAAENGHLEVVEFMVARNFECLRYSESEVDALCCAISRDHSPVVDFLLHQDEYAWDMARACEAAIALGQSELVQRIYEKDPTHLFREVARTGSADAVEYLYNAGHNDVALVTAAFESAVSWGKDRTVRFLLSTGCISSDVFDLAFLEAASHFGHIEVLETLVDAKRASSSVIDQVFKAASCTAIALKLLCEKCDISDELVVAAFRNSASSDHTEIVKIFHKLPCISSEMINEAFVAAVEHSSKDLVEFLRGDTRLATDTLNDAFTQAAAQDAECLHVASTIAKGVAIRPDVPQGTQGSMFVSAAAHDQIEVLQILASDESNDWPLDLLKNALEVSHQRSVQVYIMERICKQLFSGRPQAVNAMDSCGHDIDQLQWKIGN